MVINVIINCFITIVRYNLHNAEKTALFKRVETKVLLVKQLNVCSTVLLIQE